MLDKKEKVIVENGQFLVPFSNYKVGDLVKFKYEVDKRGFSETRSSYSKIIKVKIIVNDVDQVEFLYIMENGKAVHEKEIVNLEKSA